MLETLLALLYVRSSMLPTLLLPLLLLLLESDKRLTGNRKRLPLGEDLGKVLAMAFRMAVLRQVKLERRQPGQYSE